MATTRKPRTRRAPRISNIGEERASSVKEGVKAHKPLPGKSDDAPIGANGRPMIEIIVQSSETVPVAQYANVVLGPVGMRRWIEDTGDEEDIREAFRQGMNLVERVISEDRELVAESVAHHNRDEEEEKKSSKRK